MSRVDLAPSRRDVLARALPSEWNVDRGRAEEERLRVSRFGIVLVRTPEQYEEVIALGGQPVIIHRQFSDTPSLSNVRRQRQGSRREPSRSRSDPRESVTLNCRWMMTG
jgi:hypothetical protein